MDLKHTDSAPQSMQDLKCEIACRGGVCPVPISGLCNLMTIRSTLALTVHLAVERQPLLLIDLFRDQSICDSFYRDFARI